MDGLMVCIMVSEKKARRKVVMQSGIIMLIAKQMNSNCVLMLL